MLDNLYNVRIAGQPFPSDLVAITPSKSAIVMAVIVSLLIFGSGMFAGSRIRGKDERMTTGTRKVRRD